MRTLLLIAVIALVPSWAVAEAEVCPAVLLCDENGRYYAGVDPKSPCAQHQQEFCSELRLRAESNRSRIARLIRYTKRYSKCNQWADRASRRVPKARQESWAKALKGRSCAKYAAKAKKLSAMSR